MGKITLTPLQQVVLKEVTRLPELRQRFYLTGGTALSAFYLHHRESDDLDFFSETPFDTTSLVIPVVQVISEKLSKTFRFTQVEQTSIFEFRENEHLLIKIDFCFYPYQRLERGIKYQECTVDSLFDIASNKFSISLAWEEVPSVKPAILRFSSSFSALTSC